MISDTTERQVKAGQAPYNRLLLAVYDPLVQFNYRFLRRCPQGDVLNLYNDHVSANHLDVGVAAAGVAIYFVRRRPTAS